MFLTNDRNTEKPPELDFFALFYMSMLSAIGITTVFLSPLPMIFAELRLVKPWPRVTALFGALLALIVLGAPAIPVAAAFVFGLVIADSVGQRTNLWSLFLRTGVLVTVLGFVTVLSLSRLEGVAPLAFWGRAVDATVDFIRSSGKMDPTFSWESFRSLLFHEGPFLLLSAALLSLWVSVGTASHFGWFKDSHPLSPNRLRKLRLPQWALLLFCGFFALSITPISLPLWLQIAVGGISRVLSCVVFVQGAVILSNILKVRNISRRFRTLIYTISVFLGFYAVVGLGLLGPWLIKKSGRPQ